jgi:prepilin-type N-terminal cleavage/methylation domain-containing protein
MKSILLNKKDSGFTIVESLVAISILVVAIIGAMSAVQTGISLYTYSKDQITAFYMAQEGFEQIKNIRDENHLNGRNWLSGITETSSDPCYFGQACTVSPVESTVAIRCTAPGSCPVLRQDPTDGFYGYNSSWTATNFRREIQLSLIDDKEISATVTIYWKKGIVNRQFKAHENILNWQ